jgi:folate-binding protein YgfZ
VANLAPGTLRHAALLTPQGKIISDMLVQSDGEGAMLLDVPRLTVAEVVARLQQYRLRAKLTITQLPEEIAVLAIFGARLPDPAALGLAGHDPRHPGLGLRMLSDVSHLAPLGAEHGLVPGEMQDYHALRVATGIGEIGFDFLSNDSFPHELNMDRTGGVDFAKGCYVGQEVVSRMQHRGTARTRLVRLAYEGGFAVEAGCAVMADDKRLGTTGTPAGGTGLAMLRLDRAEEAAAAGQVMTAGGVPVRMVG